MRVSKRTICKAELFSDQLKHVLLSYTGFYELATLQRLLRGIHPPRLSSDVPMSSPQASRTGVHRDQARILVSLHTYVTVDLAASLRT